MRVADSTYRKIKDLYGYAIAQQHVGRRVLMREFDISRREAEEVLDAIRDPSIDPDDVLVVDTVEDYEYDEEADRYIFSGKDPFDEAIRFEEDGAVIRTMKRDYCMKGYKIKETALKAGYDPAVFTEIKKVFEWTHDSIPATEEELRDEKAEDVAKRLAMEQKKSDARKQLEKAKKRTLRKDARKWRKFDEVILQHAKDVLNSDFNPPNVQRIFEPDHSEPPAAVVVPSFDIHFGKQGLINPKGGYYDRGEAEDRVIESTRQLLKDATKYNIEKVYFAFGSDFFHIDNYNGATSGDQHRKAKMQDIDGLPEQIYDEGCELMRKHLDMLRQIAPVDAFMIPGNHDRLLSVTLMKYLEALYEKADDVTVDGSIATRKYRSYGRTLMGFDHGDGIKDRDIESLVLTEARDKVSETEETVFMMGHYHHEYKKDLGGATAYGLGSPSGDDRWHDKEGLTAARRQMTSFIINKERGMHAHLNYPIIL